MVEKIYDIKNKTFIDKIPSVDIEEIQKEFPNTPITIIGKEYIIIDSELNEETLKTKFEKNIKKLDAKDIKLYE